MWQSRVEIEDHSVAYFNHITAFKAPYCWTSIKGGAHTHFVGLLHIHASTKHVWAPPLEEVHRYGTSNTVMRSKYTGGSCMFPQFCGDIQLHSGEWQGRVFRHSDCTRWDLSTYIISVHGTVIYRGWRNFSFYYLPESVVDVCYRLAHSVWHCMLMACCTRPAGSSKKRTYNRTEFSGTEQNLR